MTARRAALLLAAVLLVAIAAVPAAAQCAMCKTALSGSPEGQVMSGHLNHAILMMVAAPYLVAGTVAGVLFRRQIATRFSRLRNAMRAGSGSRRAALGASRRFAASPPDPQDRAR